MDPETFAQARATRLVAADDELEPFVRDALENLIAGNPDWSSDLIVAASVLWLEQFKTEAPSADGARRLARYQEKLEDALSETSSPGFEVTEADVQRVGYWLSGFTVNDATVAGTQARGGSFKRWVSHHDDAVRSAHESADGQIVSAGGTFVIDGHHLSYPGDPVGPPEIWINCRCLAMPAAREGGAMSANTYRIGPEDDVLEIDNPNIVVSDDIAAAATITDPSDIAVEPADEEDLIDDEPEDDEELITEIPVHGVLAPEGVATGDGREFAIGSLSTRDLPIPLRYETVGTHGGQTSEVVTVGRIDQAWRDDATDAWRFTGALVLTRSFAQEVIDGIIDGTVRGVSIDGDDAEVEIQELESEDQLMEMLMGGGKTVFAKMRVAGLTIVPIPAFQEAYIALGHEFQEDLSAADRADQLAALQACGCLSQEADLTEVTGDDPRAALLEYAVVTGEPVPPDHPHTIGEIHPVHEVDQTTTPASYREFPPEDRERSADQGHALPDGSFPIENCEDLQNAIQAIGRAKDPDAAKAHIRRRHAALSCPGVELPDTWTADEMVAMAMDQMSRPIFAPGTHDGPGWITHPIPTARIRRYWTAGEGAAKIRWGAPGDFNRCRTQLAKYVANPDWLAGLCANMHKEALGIWPAQHHGSRVLTAAASALRSPVATLVVPDAETYPASWFQDPELGRAVPLRVDPATRRIFGYVAEWGVCHVGVAGFCQEVPPSTSGYAYFLKGIVDTDAGEQPVGTLTWGGHASRHARLAAATDFYDKPDAVRAYVNVGEDAYGIWFAGVVAPWATDADIAKIRGIGAVSGDWREIRGQLELIGVPIVNTPGFPLRALAASAGRQTALIGAGALRPEPVLVASGASTGLDAELVAGIARAAVAEYRHLEKVSERAAPLRAATRQRRLEAARARTTRRG